MLIIMHLPRLPEGRKDTIESQDKLFGVAITTAIAVDPGVNSGVASVYSLIPFRADRVYFRHSPSMIKHTQFDPGSMRPLELKTIPSLEFVGNAVSFVLFYEGLQVNKYFMDTATEVIDSAFHTTSDKLDRNDDAVYEILNLFESYGLEPNYIFDLDFFIHNEDKASYIPIYRVRRPKTDPETFIANALWSAGLDTDLFLFEDQFARSHKATASLVRNRAIWEAAAMSVSNSWFGTEIPHVYALANVWRRFMLREGKATKEKTEAESELRARLYEMSQDDQYTTDVLLQMSSDTIEALGMGLYGTAYAFAFYSTFGEAPDGKRFKKTTGNRDKLNERLKPTLAHLMNGRLKIVQ